MGTTAIVSAELPLWFRELRWLFLWQPSNCQEPRFPQHPPPPPLFPPTGMGMFLGAQMSLGDMMQKCQAGAPNVWGRGSHKPSQLCLHRGETRPRWWQSCAWGPPPAPFQALWAFPGLRERVSPSISRALEYSRPICASAPTPRPWASLLERRLSSTHTLRV